MTDPAEKRRVVREVVQRQDQHQRLRPERPRVRVPKRQLLHLAGVSHPERRGREVEAVGGGEFFETEVELGGDRDLPGLHEGIPDDGEVATRRRAFAGRRFPVEETEAVGAGDLPVVETVRRAYFGAGRTDETHSGPEHQGVRRAHERDGGPEGDLAGRADHRQSGRRQERVRGEHPETGGHERAPAQSRADSRGPAAATDPPDADSRAGPVTEASGAPRGVLRRRAGARARSRSRWGSGSGSRSTEGRHPSRAGDGRYPQAATAPQPMTAGRGGAGRNGHRSGEKGTEGNGRIPSCPASPPAPGRTAARAAGDPATPGVSPARSAILPRRAVSPWRKRRRESPRWFPPGGAVGGSNR